MFINALVSTISAKRRSRMEKLNWVSRVPKALPTGYRRITRKEVAKTIDQEHLFDEVKDMLPTQEELQPKVEYVLGLQDNATTR